MCTHHISYRLGLIHVAFTGEHLIGGLRIERDNDLAFTAEWHLDALHGNIPDAITEMVRHRNDCNPPMDDKLVGALNNLCKIIAEESNATYGAPQTDVI